MTAAIDRQRPWIKVDGSEALPARTDVERFVLGSVLMDQSLYTQVANTLDVEDFSLEAHRRIYRRMRELQSCGEAIDRVTLTDQLLKHNELESIGGLSYILGLDEGMPRVPNLQSYLRIVQETSIRRKIIYIAQNLMSRAMHTGEPAEEILAAAQGVLAGISLPNSSRICTIDGLPMLQDCALSDVSYVRHPELPRAAVVAFTGDSGSGKSTLVTAYIRDANASGTPALILDRENPASVIRDRLRRLGAEEGPSLRIWGAWVGEEAPMPDAPVVLDWVRTTVPKPVVLVDSLSAFFDGDQNDASETRTFMHRLRRLADLGATAVIVHHDGKAERAKDYRGSSDFKAAIDVGFHVTNGGVSELGKLTLRCFKSRYGFSGQLAYDYDDGRLGCSDVHDPPQSVFDQLKAIVGAHPGITARQLDELVKSHGIPRDQARGLTTEAVRSGIIRRQNGANNVKQFYLEETKAKC